MSDPRNPPRRGEKKPSPFGPKDRNKFLGPGTPEETERRLRNVEEKAEQAVARPSMPSTSTGYVPPHEHAEYQPIGDYQPAGNYADADHDHSQYLTSLDYERRVSNDLWGYWSTRTIGNPLTIGYASGGRPTTDITLNSPTTDVGALIMSRLNSSIGGVYDGLLFLPGVYRMSPMLLPYNVQRIYALDREGVLIRPVNGTDAPALIMGNGLGWVSNINITGTNAVDVTLSASNAVVEDSTIEGARVTNLSAHIVQRCVVSEAGGVGIVAATVTDTTVRLRVGATIGIDLSRGGQGTPPRATSNLIVGSPDGGWSGITSPQPDAFIVGNDCTAGTINDTGGGAFMEANRVAAPSTGDWDGMEGVDTNIPPGVPENLDAQVFADVVAVSWDEPSSSYQNLDGYRVYRDGNLIAQLPNTAGMSRIHSDTTVEPNRQYTYQVSSFNEFGESAPATLIVQTPDA